MKRFEVIFYEKENGEVPVEEFLMSLDKKMRAKLMGIIWKGVGTVRKFDDFLEEQLKDKEFREEYENMQPEFDVIRAMVDARISRNLTQKELAERTGIHQADISKLENGTRNPTINLLKRLADGMDMVLKIEFVPRQKI